MSGPAAYLLARASAFHPRPRTEGLLNFLVLPLLIPYSAFMTLRRWLRRNRALSSTPRFEIEPAPARLTNVAEFAARAERDEWTVRPGWGSLDFQLQYAPDTFATIIDSDPSHAGSLSRCPMPFRYVRFDSFDGTPLAGQLATRGDRDRPGLIVAHGTFGSSGQALYANQAIEAFAEWGFNVLAIDLRGWGRSASYSDAVMTSGWMEGEDILAAARYLKENSRTTTVGVVGYSLGGGSALRAAAHELAPELIAGGVLSESGFTNASDVIDRLVERPRVLDPRYLVYWIFRLGFDLKFRASGNPTLSIATYPDFVARRYGIEKKALLEHMNLLALVDAVRVPFLQLHAEDDWVVPVDQAEQLRAAARGNPLVGVCIRPRGAHCSFSCVMGKWRSRIAREFFSGVAGIVLRERPSA